MCVVIKLHHLCTAQVLLPWCKSQLESQPPANAIIIVADGHRSHNVSPELVADFKKLNIFFLILPAHCTGVLQLCDTWFFGDIKTMYREAATSQGVNFKREHVLGTFFEVRTFSPHPATTASSARGGPSIAV